MPRKVLSLAPLAALAVYTLAPLTALNGTAQATDAVPDQTRPLGVLFSPLPTQPVGSVPDVHSQETSGSTTPTKSEPSRAASSEPPLGLLLTPLTDSKSYETPSALTSITDTQLQPVQTQTTSTTPAQPGTTTDRPLGLLMDNTQFKPDPRYLTTGVAEPSITPPVINPSLSPETLWNKQGKSSNRPLGTLLIPGSYRPAPTQSRQVAPAAAPSPNLNNTGLAPVPAVKEMAETPSVNFSADEMGFDQERGIVTASGNVEIHYQNRSLRADKVSYNRATNEVEAEGNVVITEPTTEAIYGDKVKISGDLRDGFILNIGVILQDRSRIVGSSGTRTAGKKTDLSHAVYSPCNLCTENPDSDPLWQIKAVKVSHDKDAKIVEYQDAWIEFFGFPVFYTPYFRHPDPTIKRKSGFLFPTFGNSSDLGATIQTPYFWNISPHEDMTITPTVMTAENPIIAMEYRNRLIDGSIDLTSSLTTNSGDDEHGTENGRYGVRGHILSEGRFDINESWRWGFDGNWTTDDTYMRRFGFGSPDSLKSQIFAESFKNRSYFSVKSVSFQGLQADDDSSKIPLILPLADFNYVGEKDRFGGNTNFDFNFLSMTREEGTDTRRLSARSVWQRPMVGVLGDVYNISLGLNSDFYHVNDLVRGSGEDEYDGFSYRVTPEAALEWRMPFAKSDGNVSQVIEPIASFIWSPYGGNSSKIPNEDSIELEFDDTNLFRTNRFSGLDRVEGGPRIIYGLKWGAFGEKGRNTKVFIGQSWRPKVDDTYAEGSGLEDNFSDIVARLNISPGDHLDASYRTRFSPDNFSARRHEVRFNGGLPLLKLSGNYVFLEQQSGSEFEGREELDLSATSQIDRFWRTSLSGTRDMESNEMRTVGLNLTYEDECVVFRSQLTRTFFEDRDLEPTDSITFNLVLKTLGEVKTGGSVF